MPRSIESILEKRIKNKLDKELEYRKIAYVQAVETVLDNVLDETVKDCNRLYDSCIDQFYSYKTESYYRYEVGKGTRTGWRLYYGNQIKRIGDQIVIRWDGSEIDSLMPYGGNNEFSDENGEEKRSVTGDEVINRVMKGIRFTRPGIPKKKKMWWHPTLPVSTSMGTIKNRKTPNAMFRDYVDKWNSYVPKRVPDKIDKLYKNLLKNRR